MSKKNLAPITTIRKADIMNEINSGNCFISISSGNDKMGDIPFWSISGGCEPLVRSDGEILRDFGGSCGACSKKCAPTCYAIAKEVQYKETRLAYARNFLLAKYAPAEFRRQIEHYLKYSTSRYFRIHEDGEFFSYEYFVMWLDLCRKYSDIHFYVYTKKYSYVRKAEDAGIIPDNLKINISAFRGNMAKLRKMFPESKFKLFIWDDCNIKGIEDPEIPCEHCPAVLKNGRKSGTTCNMCLRCVLPEFDGEIFEDTAVYDHSNVAHKRV